MSRKHAHKYPEVRNILILEKREAWVLKIKIKNNDAYTIKFWIGADEVEREFIGFYEAYTEVL